MTKIGIELGIRAPVEAIEKAAKIADDNSVEYFLVPETHPGFFGVDALDVLSNISEKVKRVKLGTGIINVFSRTQEEILDAANQLHTKTGGKFVLGIGTSAPIIIRKKSSANLSILHAPIGEGNGFFFDCTALSTFLNS